MRNPQKAGASLPLPFASADMRRAQLSSHSKLRARDLLAVLDYDACRDVIQSAAFQRLRKVRFLGAIDYLIHANGRPPNKRHTRFDHSIAVAELALQYSRLLGLDRQNEIQLLVAALLHDIGHGPLSHSLEPVFREKLGLSHHDVTRQIVLGSGPLGPQFSDIFARHGIDAKAIVALIDGTSDAPHVEAFRSPINIDTIEAISRTTTYITPQRIGPDPVDVVRAVTRLGADDVAVLDEFWRAKHSVYELVINTPRSVLADYLCQSYLRSSLRPLGGWEYLLTEQTMRQQYPRLFSLLRKLQASPKSVVIQLQEPIEFERRAFFVDKAVQLTTPQDLYKRYRQTRAKATLSLDCLLR